MTSKSRMKSVAAAFAAHAMLFGFGSAAAQTLDYTADANYGTVSLEAGFWPDPHTVEMTSGGDVDLALAIDDDICSGYATSNPDLKLQWDQSSSGLLKLWVESEGDTTLVINDSEGDWHCDDDSAGDLNPLIELDAASGGRYDIWVGSYESDDNYSATLYVSELDDGPSSTSASTQSLDYSAEANYGTVSLEAGFWPDPHTVEMTSGGDVDLALAIDDDICSGYATSNPDLKLQWDQESSGLLKLWVESEGDTTLVINDSTGSWHCDDDSAGDLNPLIELDAASGGRYDIWVGSYESDDNYSSTLYISELDDGPGGSDAAQILDYSADANYGSVPLATGFSPNPYEVVMTSGGDVDLAAAIDSDICAGFATSNPDLKLLWEEGATGLLKLWVESEGDTTLVINDSMGNWHCDDDSAGGVNPQVELDASSGGQFDIWVGSYEPEEGHSSTLYINELQ